MIALSRIRQHYDDSYLGSNCFEARLQLYQRCPVYRYANRYLRVKPCFVRTFSRLRLAELAISCSCLPI